jgi:hypothetical protein
MAQIQPIDIVAPGALGLNTEKKNTLLPPQWATTALNAVVNQAGRVAARKGWEDQTATAITGNHTIDVIHEYLTEDGTSTILTTANNKVYKNISDYSDAANDITSSTAPTADHWQFVNFNGKVLGFQRGHTPIEWVGTGDFTDASYSGTGPDGNCAAAAFGRIWAADADKQTIRVSKLLDDTDYLTASGAGTIDMSSVWTNGVDEIVAIAAIGANLVVFGKNHIVLWADGSGSEIGMTLANAEIVDTIEGTGCIARDSIQKTGEGDLLFLSRHGLQSLQRVIASKSNPIDALTKNVRSDFQAAINTQRGADAEMDEVRSTWSPEEGLYVINFPQTSQMWVFDTAHPFQDEDSAIRYPVTIWQMGGSISGMATTLAGRLYFGSAGVVGQYASNLDDASTYDFEFWTGWLDFGQEANHRLKILKEMVATVAVGDGTLQWNWEFDFSGTTLSRSVAYTGGSSAEFDIAEFNIGEFAGSVTLQRKNIPAYGEGQFIRLGVSSTINGFDAIVQQMSIAPKLGRMIT